VRRVKRLEDGERDEGPTVADMREDREKEDDAHDRWSSDQLDDEAGNL